jgi:hypothetical protein
VNVRVEPARGHQATTQIHSLGRSSIADHVGFAPNRRHAAVAREKSFGRDPRSHMDPASAEKRRAH